MTLRGLKTRGYAEVDEALANVVRATAMVCESL